MPALGLALSLPFVQPPAATGGDTTPGGAASAWLMEDGSSGWLMEDGVSAWLMEGT